MLNFFTSQTFEDMIGGVIRHGLTSLAGILIADGVLQSSQTNDFLGSCLFLFGLGWSLWVKYESNKK